MRHLESSRIPGSLALALVAALLVPGSAQAAKALFRVQRTFYGAFQPFTAPFVPYTMPTMQNPAEPPAVAYVRPGGGSFVLPKSFYSYMYSYYCKPGQCFPGYPVSGGYSSYLNAVGGFYAGAYKSGPSKRGFGPSTTTTLVVPTTMGNNLPFNWPANAGPANLATGKMVNSTQYFGGKAFTFDRGGSIQITPGPNRFSGTMRFLNGPNSSFYQFITRFTPFKSIGIGFFNETGLTSGNPTNVGETDWTAGVSRFRLTSPLFSKKACIAGVSPCGAGNYISGKAYYFHLVGGPWTTGMIRGYQPLYKYLTTHSYGGYDNKSPAMTMNNKIGSLYATRIVSLVRPRLTHQYLRDALDPNNPIQTFSAMRTWKMNIFFLPEPGGVTLLVAGVAGLAGLAVLARRRRR